MPRKTDSNNPADWLVFAHADLETVRECLGNDLTFSVCKAKLAEAIEKLLKAELIHAGWALLKTHDLEFLAGELRVRAPESARDFDPLLEPLDEAYFSGRYPGFDLEDPDWPALRAQLETQHGYGGASHSHDFVARACLRCQAILRGSVPRCVAALGAGAFPRRCVSLPGCTWELRLGQV